MWAGAGPLHDCSTSLCSGWSVSRALLSHWPAPCLIQIGLEWPPRQAHLGHSYSKWTGFFLARWNRTREEWSSQYSQIWSQRLGRLGLKLLWLVYKLVFAYLWNLPDCWLLPEDWAYNSPSKLALHLLSRYKCTLQIAGSDCATGSWPGSGQLIILI